jgi:hypothetical protein
MPSSSSRAHTCAGAGRSTPRSAARPDALALGLRELVGRLGPRSRGPGLRRPPSPVERRARRAEQRAGLLGAVSSRRSRCSPITASTCSRAPRSRRAAPRARALFPVISSAVLVRASSASSRSLRRRRRSSSTCSGVRLALAFGARPRRTALSRALRHSARCEVYRPSRRSSAPRWSEPVGSESYSSRMRALYSAVKERRLGRAAGSGSSTTPSWARASRDAVVMVIGLGGPVSPCRGGGLLQVSHVTLTDRGPARCSPPRRRWRWPTPRCTGAPGR